MGRPLLVILDGVMVLASTPVIPLCPTCRVWGQGACVLHQPKRKEKK